MGFQRKNRNLETASYHYVLMLWRPRYIKGIPEYPSWYMLYVRGQITINFKIDYLCSKERLDSCSLWHFIVSLL